MYLQMAAHKHGEDVLPMNEILTPEEQAAAQQRARQAADEFDAQVSRNEPDDDLPTPLAKSRGTRRR
jgi:hypothetical protein